MNYAAFNSFGCDSVAPSGDNTTLSEGLSSVSNIVGAIVISAMLASGVSTASTNLNPKQAYDYSFTGGVSSDTNSYGNVAGVFSGGVYTSTTDVYSDIGIKQGGGLWSDCYADASPIRFSVTGGLSSDSIIEGKWFLPLTLYSGVNNNESTGGDLYWRSGMYGGVEESSLIGATLIHDSVMNYGLKSENYVSSTIQAVSKLTSGVHSEDLVISSVMGSTILVGTPIASDDYCDAPDMKAGRMLYDGTASTSSVDSYTTVDCVLNGLGPLSTSHVDYNLQTSHKLSSGIVSVGEPDCNLILSSDLNEGLGSFSSVNSELISSAKLLDNASNSSDCISANYICWATLSEGTSSNSVVGSMPMRSNIFLAGNDESNSKLDGIIQIDAVLFGGYSQASKIDAGRTISSNLNNGYFSSNTLGAKLRTSVTLDNGVSSSAFAEASSVIQNIFTGGVKSTAFAWTQLVVSQTLKGGLAESSSFNDAEISSYYGDMLHNNGGLEISSATILLEIETPKGDS
jgi:hypothetical protein